MEEPQKSFDIRDLLAAARRRRLTIVATLTVGILAAILLALLLPPRYRSSSTILIQQQELPADLVRSTVTSYADQRVQMISQRVMTTQTLLGIIRRYGLYPGEEQSLAREELIAKMRRDTSLDMISADVIDPRSGMPHEANIAFSLSFTSRSPEQAMRVANELSTLFLNENLTSRARLAEDASTFLRAEGDRLNSRIAELETRLATFKEKNSETLPELAAMNMQQLDRTERELQQLQARQSSLQQQKVYLEAQLVQIKPNSMLMSDTGERIMGPADRLKSAKSQLASVRAIYGSVHPDVTRLEREIAGLESDGVVSDVDVNDLERRLTSARSELAKARETHTAGHPDIQKLEREVQGLTAEVDRQPAQGSAVSRPSSPDNPAYIQLKAQLEATLVDLRGTDAVAGELRSQIADYRRNLNLSPQIEREYRELTRDYEGARIEYQQSRAKLAQAQAAQNLESDRKGERFEMIEPPLLPGKPISPNRKLIAVLGTALSLALAAALAALMEKLDGTVRGRGDMSRMLGLTPLVLIPRIQTKEDERVTRRRRRLAFGTAIVTSVAGLAAAHFLLWPLDTAWFAVLRRIGL